MVCNSFCKTAATVTSDVEVAPLYCWEKNYLTMQEKNFFSFYFFIIVVPGE